MNINDYQLGSTFEHEGVTLTVALDRNDLACNDCWFENRPSCKHPHCDGRHRADGKEVVFVKSDGDGQV
jgi:hypothetical protein